MKSLQERESAAKGMLHSGFSDDDFESSFSEDNS